MSFDQLPAASKLICETSTFRNEKSRHEAVISEHYFNFKLQVFVPDADISLAGELQHIIEGSTYFCAALPLSALIQKDFIEAFVKKGRVSMLSVGEKIDEGDVIAVTPNGHLVMHVTKDTFECLGLEGRASQFTARRSSCKYVIDVDLTKDFFKPGKKNYERVRDCLEKRYAHRRPVFLFWWEPVDPTVSPLSLAAYFESLGYVYEEIRNAMTVSHRRDVLLQPTVNALLPEGSVDAANHEEFFEWLGAMACDVDVSCGSADGFVTTLQCPEPDRPMNGMTVLTSTGYVPSDVVRQVLARIRALGSRGGTSWSCVAVHGFSDSPVSWKLREHMYNFDGDNLYAFVIWPDDNYWLYTAIGSMDVCP